MSSESIIKSWTVYKSDSCKLEDYSLIGRTFDELETVFDWALRNSDTEFGLGVLAAMNYVTCRDEQTPEERGCDKESIRKAANSWGEVTLDWANCEDDPARAR